MTAPPAEVVIDEELVRGLLDAQHPDLAGLALERAAAGWDNELWRLGDDLVVRLPRRAMGAELVRHEQLWLPRLAPRLPLPVPAPQRVGAPVGSYPWHWSICPWLPGDDAVAAAPADPYAAAESLGAFVAALHGCDVHDAPENPYRGRPLAERDELTRTRLASLAGRIDAGTAAAASARWDEAIEVPEWQGPPVLLHGDLHPANLLVRDGVISAVLDFGDLCGGDPACDLAIAWMLLPPLARPVLRDAAGVIDDDTWRRALGWALALALAMVPAVDDLRISGIGFRTLDAVLAEPAA